MPFINHTVETAGDAFYQFFDPFRALFRYIFQEKKYRVVFVKPDGTGITNGAVDFTAENDHQARREARKIAGGGLFEIETYRMERIITEHKTFEFYVFSGISIETVMDLLLEQIMH